MKKVLPHPYVSLLCFVILLLSTNVSSSASDPQQKLGNWIGATSSMRFTYHWSLFVQGELRTWEMASNLNELLWRIAIIYDLNKSSLVSIGYVRVDTWPFDDDLYDKFDENRFYQEYLIKHNWGKTKLNHRFRVEQRWITTKEYGTEFSSRLRYKIQFTIPLGKTKVEPGTYFIKALNEIFVDVDRFDYWFDYEERAVGLNQNRLMVSFGRQMTMLSSLRLGLMWQHRPKADFARLIVAYSHNLDFRAK